MSKFGYRNTKAAKLTPGVVADIRREYAQGGVTQGELARRYQVSVIQIGRIVRGESWNSVQVTELRPEDHEAVKRRLLSIQADVDAGRINEVELALPADQAHDRQEEGSGIDKLNQETRKHADQLVKDFLGEKR